MDRLTALVAIAHLKLRLEFIERNPQLLDEGLMEIRRPMELAGLKARLTRAKKQEGDIALTGTRFDKVMDQIDELHGVSKNHVGQLEVYAGELRLTVEGMVAGSNGLPNEDSESSTASSDGGQG
ncbi:hypothetical protein [Bradyrhizobium sp. WSM4349]|uniref:hypothetical protein n=1 Tax=Bradyrhizobium sp. WSM4349 TaxID=1040988 RepID=UPI000365FF16|nr:hypothetical protein [Bradyrhizobium sp. WSM4349]